VIIEGRKETAMRLLARLVVAIVLIGGCGTDESEPELSEAIIGTWVSERGLSVTFNDDGTYNVGTDTEFGTWSVDGDVLTKVTDEDSRYCPGVVGTYETEVLDDGERLESTVVDDECPHRQADFLSLSRAAETET
jgi:hypothetical protein